MDKELFIQDVNVMLAEHYGLWIEMIQSDPAYRVMLATLHNEVQQKLAEFREQIMEEQDRRWCAEEAAENEEFGRL